MNEIITCEVCGNTELVQVLDLGSHPMCDDLVPLESSESCSTYPIEILYCEQCCTAHQRYQVPKVTLFPQTYHYRSRFTADVLRGMADLVDSVELQMGSLDGCVVLDVGCNDGSLLDKFSAKGAKTIGVEPTGAHVDAKGREHAVINDFFTPSTAKKIVETHGPVDVITFTNVFAHIEDLPELLRAVKATSHEATRLVIENHYLGAVLAKNQFDTFYHEHPRTYSFNSFVHIAKTIGKQISTLEFPSRYGGNIRVTIGGKPASDMKTIGLINQTLARESKYLTDFAGMRSFITCWKKQKSEEIQKIIQKNGPLAAKAFPGRAAILIQCLGLDENQISAVYEKPGSMKIGNFIPGTRIPIKTDDQFFELQPKPTTILNLAWHISGEIREYLKNNGYLGEVIDILDTNSVKGL